MIGWCFFAVQSYPVVEKCYPYPNPVLVKIMLSWSENYPRVYHRAQQKLLSSGNEAMSSGNEAKLSSGNESGNEAKLLKLLSSGNEAKLLSSGNEASGNEAHLERSNVAYKLKCSCGHSYIGQTQRNLKFRLDEHNPLKSNHQATDAATWSFLLIDTELLSLVTLYF